MNSVSWFLYAANTLENIGVVLGVGGILGLIVTGFVSAMYAMGQDKTPPWWRLPVIICAVCIAISTVIPDKKTVLMIAASQMGERVANTEAATEISQEALAALRSWLREQTKSK